MTHLRYKEYQGSVTFVDDVLIIQILHIDDYVTTECQVALQAQSTFEELVDDYIQTCIESNKQPSKPFKGSFNVRVTPVLHRSIAMRAAEASMSMNSWVEHALTEKIDRQTAIRRIYSPANLAKIFGTAHHETWRWDVTIEREAPANPIISTRATSVYN